MEEIKMQTRTSFATSINANRAPALFTNYYCKELMKDKDVLDYGCGRYDTAEKAAREYAKSYFGIDRYNRPMSDWCIAHKKKYDVVTCANVLNVIDDLETRVDCIYDMIYNFGATDILISVYEGDGTGIGRESSPDCWQENRKTASYYTEIQIAIMRGDSICKVERKGKVWHIKRLN